MKYTTKGNDLINVCGMYKWAMRCDRNTFDKDARDEAARLWILTDLFPQVPAAHLKRFISGTQEGATVTFDRDNDTITLEMKE